MKRKVSEFSYGFVLTHELVNAYGYFRTDAPQASRGGRKKGAEDGAGAAPRGYPLFLQFKASEYMKRRNAGESKLVGLPYFRFALHRKTQSNQHQLLIELEKKGYAVFIDCALIKFRGYEKLHSQIAAGAFTGGFVRCFHRFRSYRSDRNRVR